MLWNKFSLFTFKIICNIILSITKKTARIWKLASWMMVQAPPTTASLFWFYYSPLIHTCTGWDLLRTTPVPIVDRAHPTLTMSSYTAHTEPHTTYIDWGPSRPAQSKWATACLSRAWSRGPHKHTHALGWVWQVTEGGPPVVRGVPISKGLRG